MGGGGEKDRSLAHYTTQTHTAFSQFSPTRFLYAFNSGRAEVGGNIIHWAMPFFVAIELNLCVCVCVVDIQPSFSCNPISQTERDPHRFLHKTLLFSRVYRAHAVLSLSLSNHPHTHHSSQSSSLSSLSLTHSLSWALRPWLSH